MAETSVTNSKLNFGFLVLLYASTCCTCAADTISQNQIIRYNDTIVSQQETFELGFFSPGNSMNHYVGIWYKKRSHGTVVWVANRNTPLNHTSGELTLTPQGVLSLQDTITGSVLWNSSSTTSVRNPILFFPSKLHLPYPVVDQNPDPEKKQLFAPSFQIGRSNDLFEEMTSTAGIQMFMEKLKQLINCNDNPLINNPWIMFERPGFQRLYDDLGYMMQTLLIDQHQELEEVNDLKRRFICAAEEAEYMVDLFLSRVHRIINGYTYLTSEEFALSLKLDEVGRTLKSVYVEFMSKRTESMEMSPRPERTLNQADAAPINSKELLDEIVVGIDGDVELIRDKLVEEQKRVVVVSIVGMGGIGKTTLATKVFNDGYVKHHFHVRVWITISQKYDKRGVLIQILTSIGVQKGLEEASDSRLREMVHKKLLGRRYLIVIDDIWDMGAWDNLKIFFPHDNNGSRILLTSRLVEVAKHANSDGLIHRLGYLNKERCWELLCQKVFHGNEYPMWSLKPGMQIIENCRGLPLAVVVVAGILAKEAWNNEFWLEIACRTSSYIVGEENGCMETLALSYNHLPLHLRECFLYLGSFPEDYMIQVKRLILLWVAEGFIQEDGSKTLEDIAEDYLKDLIDRNLVIKTHVMNYKGAVRCCKVHDLIRELCIRKAKEEGFMLQSDSILSSEFSNVATPPYKPVRVSIYNYTYILEPVQNLRSILYFGDFNLSSDGIAKRLRSFALLRVLDLKDIILEDFPKSMELLVHLRYLAIFIDSRDFPSSICNLWSLQTLVYNTNYGVTTLPCNISNLVNLRHLLNSQLIASFYLPSIEKPMKLQTIYSVELGDGVDSFQKCFPYIKELTCATASQKKSNFQSLTNLEKLNLTWEYEHDSPKAELKNHITFPVTLKALTLRCCRLHWSDMSIIQSLPNLQVLILKKDAFVGSCWNTYGQEFPQLKFLILKWLNIKQWEAFSPSFPCLRQLEVFRCMYLEEIPLEIGDIPTLELIKVMRCRRSVGESVTRIEEEQHDLGNYDLKYDVSCLKD